MYKKKKKIPQIVKEIKAYKLMEVKYAFQKAISFSQFQIYSKCPLQWKLRYVDGFYEQTPTINLCFGTAMHEIIQKMITMLYEGTTKSVDEFDLEEHFQEAFLKAYKEEYEKNGKVHFSDAAEMNEFFIDGLNILFQLRKRKGAYFSKKGWHLIGCEIPILVSPFENKNILFKGFIDLVMYHEATNKFVLFDFKTSKAGWGKWDKKDDIKTSQLLLYKQFFAKQFNILPENIEVEYFILRRKLPEDNQFYIKHISQFRPIAGKTKMKKSISSIEKFIEDCFNEKGHIDKEYTPTPDKFKCKYCPFSQRKDLCSKSIT